MKNVTKMLLMLLVIVAAFGLAPQARSQTILLTESFENGGAIPPNWSTVIVSGSTNGISFITSGTTGYPAITVTPYNGSYEVFYNAYSIVSGSTRLYRTAGTSTVGFAGASVDFAMFHDLGYAGTSGEGVTVQYSIDGGANWTSTGGIVLRNDGSQGWKIHTIILPANAGNQANLRIAFLFSSQFGNNCFLDFAHLNGFNTGTLAGTVTDACSGAPIVGVSVVINALPAVLTNAAGYYTNPNVPGGNATINATKAGYSAYSGTATVVAGTTTIKNFTMNPTPTYLTGFITNASTNAPVLGAWVSVGSAFGYTLPNGSYLFQTCLTGSQTVTVFKPGYILNTGTANIVNGGTTTYNAALLVDANPPGPVTAALNGTSTAVDINWSPPSGLYEIIYDDGGQENWTVWAVAANMNAVKFTPITGGATVMAGRVNIGTAANYAAGTDPTLLAPFQIAVYDATGPGGTPGVQIGATIDVIPANFGWNTFTFSTPIGVTGTFYLVMIQGGTPPNAVGLAVDETTNKLRSYSHFGAGPWLPASGNYMLRAVVAGLGGPLDIDVLASKLQITANPIQGLIYDHTPASVTGVEGEATYLPFDWASVTKVANVQRPANTSTYTNTDGTAADVDLSGIITEPGSYTPLNTDAPMATLFDNGPIFNSTGTGAGGANESIYYQGGTGTYGSGCQYSSGIYIADDFTVPSGKTWALTSINFYSYQTNSTTTSTITGIYVRVWNAKPGVAGSTVVWGDMTTNRLGTTNFANVYRVLTVNGGVARPIMNVVANTPGLSLTGGTYWVEWACTGTLASGPWCAPVVTANNVTGNSIQTTDYGVTYVDNLYNNYAQGMPFVMYGTEITPGGIPYTVWRLLEGQEANEPLWGAPIASNITATSVTDNSWPSLPCGPYRWAVKAGYPVNRLSPPTFSNVIGKCWTADVTVNVSLTCAVTPVAGAVVKLQNTVFSQYVYTATVTSTGTVDFPAVWKGTYDLTVTKIGYDPYLLAAQTIMGPMTFDVVLLQQRLAPSNMFVNNKSLIAIWNAPVGLGYPLFEDWASGNFTTNNWTAEAVWAVNTGFGNPAPTAEFYYYPTLTNYSRSLTSKTLTGTGAPDFKLMYDIYLSDYLGDGNEQLDVELSIAGGAWNSIKHYANQGSIAWTTETIDIASVGSQNFQIRFRAHGSNSYNINNWDFDNIKVRSVAPDPKPCILAYNIYLNGVLDGVTPTGLDTTYQIPPSHVTYGTVYTACVKAVYGSGYSGQSCYTFTSKFLWPPMNVQATAVECAAYLTWEKPVATKKVNVPAFRGTIVNTASSTGLAPINRSQIDHGQVQGQRNPDNVTGSIVFGMEAIAGILIDFDEDNLPGFTTLGPSPLPPPDFLHMVYPKNENNLAYATSYYTTHLYTIDHTTLAWTDLGSYGSGTFNDLTVDPTTGILYGTDGASLYSIDPTVPSKTLVGSHGGGISLMIGLAVDGNGDMWAYDLVNDMFYSVDKATGTATGVGSIGFNANYAQTMFYDQPLDQVIMAAMNGNTLTCEIRVVDVTTGASTVSSSLYYNEVTGAALPVGGGTQVQGLLGYKIYRDGPQVHYVGDPDTLFWYDFTVEPGSHVYQVSAWYDLTDYGYPGQFDESLLQGPANIDIECGIELPFFEPWTQGSFGFQNWTLSPANTNWSVNANVGNPAPSADFSWVPIQYDYSLSLVTPVLNGGPFTCSMIWCDFDYKLIDRNMTGNEKLYVDVFFKGTWKNKAEFSNTGNKDWTPMHVDISAAKGKAFKVRFRAEGANSADILHWYVDNVHIYAKCNPPVELSVGSGPADRLVTLTWKAPVCGAAGPEPQWIHWDDGTNSTSIGTGGAVDFYCAARWDASQIVALDGGAVTKIAFYPASAGTGSFRIRVWEGPDAATMLVDQAVPTVTWDDWNIIDVAAPVPIDITQELWIGYDINATGGWPAGCDAGPAVVGYGDMIYFTGAWASMYTAYGLNYNWNIQGYVEPADDHATSKKVIPLAQNMNYKSGGTLSASGLPSLNATKFNPGDNGGTDSQTLLGYNIYRKDSTSVIYNKLNTALLTDTNYVDLVPKYTEYCYYVTSVFPTYPSETCESDSSNVKCVDVIEGIDQLNGGKISIYPNPATDNVVVKSDFTITNVEVLNYIGQTVYSRQNVSEKTLKVNVANLTTGIYFVKVTTLQGIKTVKITVTK